jgi:GNAT superfamily N-acetyltransferase
MTISVRRGQLEDAPILFELARQYQSGRVPIGRDEFTIALDNILRQRDQETNVLFVVVEETSVVGYSLLTVSRLLHAAGLAAHLQEIVVNESARGKGYGDRLIQANEHYCSRRGVSQLSASTARMGSFYNHRGFEVVGEHYRKVLDLG